MGNNPSSLLEGLTSDAKYIDLSNQGLDVIPHEIVNFPSIINLNLSGNKISNLPKPIFDALINLERINLSNNSLNHIPSGLKQIKNLKRLVLRQNRIVTLNSLVPSVPLLEELDLGQNQIRDVPKQISVFTNLLEFDLSGNIISKVHHCLPSTLTILNLSQNNISEFDPRKSYSESHHGCSQLQILRLQKNLLTACLFHNLENLVTLDLSNNFLTTLDCSLSQLKQLKHLILLGNKLTELPDFISTFECLQTLDVRINNISTIPPLANISTLQIIKASNNPQLTKFCSSSCQPTSSLLLLLPDASDSAVDITDVSTISISNGSEDVEGVTNTKITINGKIDTPIQDSQDSQSTHSNELKQAPSESGNSSGNMSRNHSDSIEEASETSAPSIGSDASKSIEIIADNCNIDFIDPNLLLRTSSLYLLNNSVHSITTSIPNHIIKRVTLMDNNISSTAPFNHKLLPNLSFLNLEKNQITTILLNTIDTLENLTVLNIARNCLSSLPQKLFEKMKNISRIVLDHNSLTKIPNSISECVSLKYFSVTNNSVNFSRLKRLVNFPNSLLSFNLSYNPLKTFPSSILQGKTKLTTLLLIGCRLSGNLVLATNLNLMRLNVSQNQLSAITNIPKSLRYATLGLNKFTDLRFLLPACHSLKSILAPLNPIPSLPPGSKFSSLEQLNISDTLFSKLPTELPRLLHLNVSNTLLTRIDGSFLGSSPNLEYLDISGLPQCVLKLDPTPFLQGLHNFRAIKSDLSDSIARSLLFSLHPELFEITPTHVDYGPLKVWKHIPPLLRAPVDLVTRTSVSVTPSVRFPFGHVEFQGLRPTMEDSLILKGQFYGSKCDLFAILDGHGGWQASHWLAKNIPEFILASFDRNNIAKTLSSAIKAANKALFDAMQHPIKPKKMKPPRVPSTSLNDDNHIVKFCRTQALSSSKHITERQFKMDRLDHESLITGSEYHANTYVMKNHHGNYPGTTMVLALIIHDVLYVANIGDSRAVLGRSNGTAIDLSIDHKPLSPQEYQRIRENRGTVDEVRGSLRVNMVLAVSRALGDFQLDNISSEPEITSRTLIYNKTVSQNTPGNHPTRLLPVQSGQKVNISASRSSNPSISSPSSSKTDSPVVDLKSPRRISDSFLDSVPNNSIFDSVVILACDGVWDVVTSEEAVRIVLTVRNGGGSAQVASHCLVNRAFAYGSTDNISCIVIYL